MGKILSPNQQIDNKERHQQVHELVRQASYSNQLLKYNTTRYLVAEFEVKMSKKGEVPVEGVLLLWNDCIIFAQEEPNKGVSCGDKNLLCLFVLMLVDIRDIQKIQDSETQFFLFLEASTFEISFSSGIDSHAFQEKLSFWKTIGYIFSEKKYFLSAGSTFIFHLNYNFNCKFGGSEKTRTTSFISKAFAPLLEKKNAKEKEKKKFVTRKLMLATGKVGSIVYFEKSIWISVDNEIFIAEGSNPQKLQQVHKDKITVLVVKGSFVWAGSRDGTVSVWFGKRRSLKCQLEGHKSEVTSIATSDSEHCEENWVVTAEAEGKFFLWNPYGMVKFPQKKGKFLFYLFI